MRPRVQLKATPGPPPHRPLPRQVSGLQEMPAAVLADVLKDEFAESARADGLCQKATLAISSPDEL